MAQKHKLGRVARKRPRAARGRSEGNHPRQLEAATNILHKEFRIEPRCGKI